MKQALFLSVWEVTLLVGCERRIPTSTAGGLETYRIEFVVESV
jgi:hypothetical protein